jgi:hypothetical protein
VVTCESALYLQERCSPQFPPKVRPRKLLITTLSGTVAYVIDGLRWEHWGVASTAGRGRMKIIGHGSTSYDGPVTVLLDRRVLASCEDTDQRPYQYTRMRVRAPERPTQPIPVARRNTIIC